MGGKKDKKKKAPQGKINDLNTSIQRHLTALLMMCFRKPQGYRKDLPRR